MYIYYIYNLNVYVCVCVYLVTHSEDFSDWNSSNILPKKLLWHTTGLTQYTVIPKPSWLSESLSFLKPNIPKSCPRSFCIWISEIETQESLYLKHKAKCKTTNHVNCGTAGLQIQTCLALPWRTALEPEHKADIICTLCPKRNTCKASNNIKLKLN